MFSIITLRTLVVVVAVDVASVVAAVVLVVVMYSRVENPLKRRKLPLQHEAFVIIQYSMKQ